MNKIRELRKEKKLTMKQLGAIFSLSESTISLYENGKHYPDMETMQKFADFFNVSVDYLLGREDAQIKKAPVSDPETEAREKLVSILMEYTPDELQRIMDFAAGIKASRE